MSHQLIQVFFESFYADKHYQDNEYRQWDDLVHQVSKPYTLENYSPQDLH